MDKSTFNILYKDTIESLRAHRLLDALNALSGLMPESEELAVTREDYWTILSRDCRILIAKRCFYNS